MKSKKAQRILLFCVLVVWGLIFYRIFFYLKKEDPVKAGQMATSNPSKNKTDADSLILLLNYPDPFRLSNPISIHYSGRKTGISSGKKLVVPVIEGSTLTPKLIYKGTIYNQIKHKNIGIVVSNQNSLFLSEGDSIQSWKVAKIYKDSLLITHSKQRVCIILSK